jgi:CRP-like cAMP-binding protein
MVRARGAMTTGDSATSRELFMASFAQGRSTKLLARTMPLLVRAMRDVHIGPGEALFRVGDVAGSVFFVANGRVDVVKRSRHTTYGERSVLGTSDVLLERPRTQDAIALAPVHVLELPAISWLEILEDNAEAAMAAISGVAANVDTLRRERAATTVIDGESTVRISSPEALTLVDRIVTLRATRPFRRARIQTLASLAATADVLKLGPSEELFTRAVSRRAHYVVALGEVEATRVDPAHVERFGQGSFVLGPASFVRRIAFDATATRPATILRLSDEIVFDVSEDHADLSRSILMWLEEERDLLV